MFKVQINVFHPNLAIQRTREMSEISKNIPLATNKTTIKYKI